MGPVANLTAESYCHPKPVSYQPDKVLFGNHGVPVTLAVHINPGICQVTPFAFVHQDIVRCIGIYATDTLYIIRFTLFYRQETVNESFLITILIYINCIADT
jgi:hypothetical protein